MKLAVLVILVAALLFSYVEAKHKLNKGTSKGLKLGWLSGKNGEKDSGSCPDCETCVSPPPSFCSPNPCRHGGTCTENEDRFQCACTDDFGGTNCEKAHLVIYAFGLFYGSCKGSENCYAKSQQGEISSTTYLGASAVPLKFNGKGTSYHFVDAWQGFVLKIGGVYVEPTDIKCIYDNYKTNEQGVTDNSPEFNTSHWDYATVSQLHGVDLSVFPNLSNLTEFADATLENILWANVTEVEPTSSYITCRMENIDRFL